MENMPIIHVKFYSETLGQEIGEVYIKNLMDAVRANTGRPDELMALRSVLQEAVAIADNLIYNAKRGKV
jgi:hypothetical protein